MGELWILSGVPASGKSTWAKEQADENYIWISRDEIRNEILGFDRGENGRDKYFSKETLVYNTFIDAIVYNLNKGLNVIADATHATKSSRTKLLRRVLGHPDLEKEPLTTLLVFPTYYTKCISRNEQRQGWRRVPNAAIEKMYKDFLRDLKTVTEEGFDTILVYDEKNNSFECKYIKDE